MHFTDEQNKLIFTAVRRYQEMNWNDSKTYNECGDVLDKLFDAVYTQVREQPT
jgi:hemerythrin